MPKVLSAPSLAGLACLALLAGCAAVPHRAAVAPRAGAGASGEGEEGLASWYGEPYHGRATASGGAYDMRALTAAHRTLPFGTRVAVENLDNGRTVELTITDRGPFVDGRVLDLSRAGAEALDAVEAGVVPVRIRVLRLGDGMVSAACWEVQVGAFASAANLERAKAVLARRGLAARTAAAGGGLTRVRVTGMAGREAAEATAAALAQEFPGAAPVPCGGAA